MPICEKRLGITPTTTRPRPSRTMSWPISDASALKLPPPGRFAEDDDGIGAAASSFGSKRRPINGGTPNIGNAAADTCEPTRRTASPRPVSVIVVGM